MPTSPETTGESKLVSLDELPALREALDSAGEEVVLCHGIFDLLHPGHVAHLQQARALGDRLVVSVTADEYVRRGPGRPVFEQDLRVQTLAALACVDHVVLSEEATAIPVIEALRPDYYCKGREYAEPAETQSQNFEAESARVEALGGEVRLLSGQVFSSTQLVNQHFEVLPEPARTFAEEFRRGHDRDDVARAVDQLAELSVLVIGEVIVDEYVTCDVQGVTVKERVPSVRQTGHDRHLGGSYAIARHLAGVCGRVTLAGIAPDHDPMAGLEVEPDPRIEHAFVVDPAARTIVKQRYVVENKLRAELGKVFVVHHMSDPGALAASSREELRGSLRELMAAHDLVVVSDYGHGLLDQTTMDVIQEEAPFLALNCQTNSSNYGFNLITKYRRADTFSLDEIELRLAFRGSGDDALEVLLGQLREQLGAQAAWLTLGAAGSVGIDRDGRVCRVPALTLHARDTLGAGDAFFSLASPSARCEQPLEVGSFIGGLAGALAVNVTGNAQPVAKPDLVRFAATILNV